MLRRKIAIAVLICLFASVRGSCTNEKCLCKNIESVHSIRVKCGGSEELRVTNLKEFDFSENATNILSLDFSKNAIANIDREDFKNFTELKRLDLSSNVLREINAESFSLGLANLERLKLSNNSISHIYQGAFDNLPNLKQVDISNNPLVCDCDLIWLLDWSNTHLVKLQPAPKCEAPSDFRGTFLKKLKVGVDLHCESPLQPLLELIPTSNQVVFEGDELLLQCRAPRVAIGVPRESEDLPTRAHIFWGWSEKIRQKNSTEDIIYQDPTKVFTDVFLTTKHTTDSGILNSILKISSVTVNHTGMWDCTLRSQQANLSQAISVIVISKSTEYCQATTTRTNKGIYYWPQAVRGQTVQQACVMVAEPGLRASYHCNEDGSWGDLQTEDCPFVSETTRMLEQFAKVNLTLTKGNVNDIAWRLHNFTNKHIYMKKLRDPMDLEFIARTLLQYLEYMRTQNDIAYLMLGIISQLFALPHRMFYEAQRHYRSGTKLLSAAEMAAAYVQASPLKNYEEGRFHSVSIPKNFFIDYFSFRLESFGGITCLWLRSNVYSVKRTFECNVSNETFPIFEKNVDAAIHIPINLLFKETQKSIKLMVAIFRNGNLLPYLNSNQSQHREMLLTSAIIGTKIAEEAGEAGEGPVFDQHNLHDKISVILRPRPYHDAVSEPVAAWWDSEAAVWNTSVCEHLFMHRGLFMFSCTRLGYYGLLQQTAFLNDFENEDAGALFRFLPPGIYVGCTILFCCTWINIATFVAFGRAVRINRLQRHSLVNTWLALSLLCTTFALGIYQTEDLNICRMFGILLHYLSLCVLLWVCVSMSTMYKRLSKNHRVLMETDMPKDGQVKKPIMGIYLVGWGIGLIICGISSAVNINEYASYSFCFLANETAFNAILVPAVILLLFLGILFLCIYYHINQRAINVLQSGNQFSDNTQATENIDMDWLDSTHSTARRPINGKSNTMEQYRSLTLSNPLSSIVDDFERSNMAHLRAHFFFLVLYGMSWLSAAAYIHHSLANVPNSEMYTILFAIFSSLLGFFLLVFYTLSRNDTRTEWSKSSCCSSDYKGYSSTCNTALQGLSVNPTLPYRTTFECNNSGSRSNSQCSKNRSVSARSIKSTSHKNERTGRGGMDCQTQHLLGATPSVSANVVTNNQHSSSLSAGMSHEIPSADVFYNPNQINVARKFFKKQKRLAKRNNFELQRHMERFDCTDNASDLSSLTGGSGGHLYSRRHNAMTLLSGGGGKVNNTNIHYKSQLNAFGSNKSSDGFTQIRAENMMMMAGSNSLRGRSQGLGSGSGGGNANSDVLANIYTNIPETKAPQHEIIKLRSMGRSARRTPVETLNEHDELEQEENESGDLSEEQVPLYENTNAPNFFNKSNITHSTPTKEASLLEHTEVEAMNSLGLPEPNSIMDMTDKETLDEPEEVLLDLQRDEIYVSNSLQITTRVAIEDDFPAMLIRVQQQQQSKSLNNLNDILGAPAGQQSLRRFNSICSSADIAHSASASCKAIEGSRTIRNGGEQFESEFLDKTLCSDKCELGMDAELPHMRTLSASPTNESDLNYQNSEISIRSHGLYAPQGDNDLNLTLTDEFPYQSSNASEMDDVINDFDEDFLTFGQPMMNNDLDGHDIESSEAMNTSIDELYEAIKRRSPNMVAPTAGEAGSRCPLIGSSSTSLCNNFMAIEKSEAYASISLEDDGAEAHSVSNIIQQLASAKPFKENLNDTLEDDSSQSSVISYIDPKEMKS